MGSVNAEYRRTGASGIQRLGRVTLLLVLLATSLLEPACASTPQDNARALFERFVAAQNAHDVGAVNSMIWNSSDFLWVSRGQEIRGADEAMKVYRSYYEGTWHLEPDMTRFSATVITDDVVQVLVPVVFSRGALDSTPQQATFLISQTLVRQADGWHVATILPVANTKLK
jgi:ketosteroid isomerase-like protein